MGSLVRLLAIAFLGLASGCVTPPQSAPHKSTLWRIQSSHHTVWLMGSIHLLPKSAYPLNPALNRAFSDAQQVVFEIPLENEQKAVSESLHAGLYPKGETLSRNLSPITISLLKPYLARFDLPMEKLQPFRPWLVADLLTGLYLADQGYRSELGLDIHFFKRAQKSGKPTASLETPHAQTVPFRGLSDEESDRYLREALLSFPYTSSWFRQMFRAWEHGDIETLNAMINHSAQKERKFYKSIFDDRNKAWMPSIRRYLAGRKNTLIIVGSGHLVGKNGIVEQLRNAGYQVEQM